MINGMIHYIFLAESALSCIDTSILVFYHQGRQGRRDIRLRPRPAWPVRPRALPTCHGTEVSISEKGSDKKYQIWDRSQDLLFLATSQIDLKESGSSYGFCSTSVEILCQITIMFASPR